MLRLLEQKQKTPFPAMIKQKDNFKGRTTTMHFFLIRTVLLAQMAFFSQNTAENCYYYIPCRRNNNQSIHTIHEEYEMALKDHNWIFPHKHAIDLRLCIGICT